MTAINIRLCADRIEVVTDCLYVAPERSFAATKVFHLPQANAVFAMRGLGSMLPLMFLVFSELGRSFDALIEGAGGALRQIVEAHGSALPPEASRIDIAFAGFSETRGAEAYLLSTYAPNGTPAEAYELQPVEYASITPHVDLTGLDVDAGDFLHHVLRRQAAAYPNGIGGIAQTTVVSSDAITTTTIRIPRE